MSSKIKEEKKKKKKEKKIIESHCFALKPEHCPRGLWRKPLKLGALSQLVGSRRLSVRYTGGWVSLASCRCWRLKIIRSQG